MPASTLALGQAAYDLLDELDGNADGQISADLESITIRENVRSSVRGGVINGLSIGADGNFSFNPAEVDKGTIDSLNILDRSRNFTFTDSDLDTTEETTSVDGVDGVYNTESGLASNADINFLGSAESANVGLGGGDNSINASRDFTNSEIQSLDGADTVRIGGSADGSFLSTGAGKDNLRVARSSEDLNVSMGDGDDEALFLGALTPGESRSTSKSITSSTPNDGVNIVNMGRGDDKVEFIGGIQGSNMFQFGTQLGWIDSYDDSGYEVQLGAGNDLVEFGSNSNNSGFALNTDTGQDTVVLGGSTQFAQFDLGSDSSGDSVVLGAGAEFMNSVIRSSNSAGDTLRLAGDVIDSAIRLGSGDDSVKVDGVLDFTQGESVWDLAGGDDTLVFGELSTLSTFAGEGLISLGTGADELSLEGSALAFGDVEFDLGLDADVDTIRFDSSTGYSGVVISNFGDNDILFIGEGQYGFGYEFLNEFANAAQIDEFQSAGNVIWGNSDATNDISTDDQTPMVLDLDTMDVVNTDVDGAGTVEVAVGTGEDTSYSLITVDQQSDLSDAANWDGFESDPTSDTGYVAPKSDESDSDPFA